MSLAPKFKPGQFFQLRIHPRSNTPLLRRPFAPSEVDGKDLAFVYAVVGQGTRAMTALKKGEQVWVLGPLGNGYPLPRKGARALLVGGGCGTPSLRFLAEAMTRRGVKVYTVIGARSACTLLERQALTRLSTMIAIATDDGSRGLHGNSVDAARLLLDEIGTNPLPTIFACGPAPMLKALAALAAQRRQRCYVSLEERMACGFGACMGCAVAVRDDSPEGYAYKRVCHDGPVFAAEDLVWA